MLTWTYLIYFM